MMMANKIVQNNPRALNQYQNNVAMKVNLKRASPSCRTRAPSPPP